MICLQLFVKYNIHFAGLSRSIFRGANHADGTEFADLVAVIGSMSFDSTNLHWRYGTFIASCRTIIASIFTKSNLMIPMWPLF